MDEAQMHALGVRMAMERLAGEGWTVLAAEPRLGRFPQVVAERDGQRLFALVHSSVYPEHGRLSEDEAAEVLEFAEGHEAKVVFYGAMFLNPEGEDDAQMSDLSAASPEGTDVSVSLRGPIEVEVVSPRMWEASALPSDVAGEAQAAAAFAALCEGDPAGFLEMLADESTLLVDGEVLARGRAEVSEELTRRIEAVRNLGLPFPTEPLEQEAFTNQPGDPVHTSVRLGLDALGETPVEVRFTLRQGRVARIDMLRLE